MIPPLGAWGGGGGGLCGPPRGFCLPRGKTAGEGNEQRRGICVPRRISSGIKDRKGGRTGRVRADTYACAWQSPFAFRPAARAEEFCKKIEKGG